MITGKALGRDKYSEMAKSLPKDRDERATKIIQDSIHAMGSYIRSLEMEEIDNDEIASALLIAIANIAMNSFQFLTKDHKTKALLISELNIAFLTWIKRNAEFEKMN